MSIVIPVFNEKAVLSEFLQRLTAVAHSSKRHEFEFVFVDDGSTDGSDLLLADLQKRDSRLVVCRLSRNFGHQAALTAGMDIAKGDCVVTIDCDLQDPPEVIPEMLSKWEGGADVVYGRRTSRETDSFLKRGTATVYYRVLDRLTDEPIPRDVADFRLLSRRIVDVLSSLRESNPYLRGLVAWLGYQQSFVDYERDERFAGESKYTWRKMFRLATSGITSFTVEPLRLSYRFGLLISTLTLGYAFVMAILKLINPDHVVSGYVSLAVISLFLGGIQLFAIGLIGLYIGDTNQNVKHRPRYLIDYIHSGRAVDPLEGSVDQ